MAISGTLRHGDGRALGNPDQVKAEIARVFPGTEFGMIRRQGHPLPRSLGPALILIWLFEPPYPYWEGTFEGDSFAALFQVGDRPSVKVVGVTLYGRQSTDADAYFDRLFENTGWRITF